MISDIITSLDSAAGSSTNLYFIIRNKNYRTGELSYKIMRSSISTVIGEELRVIGLVQLKDIARKNPEY